MSKITKFPLRSGDLGDDAKAARQYLEESLHGYDPRTKAAIINLFTPRADRLYKARPSEPVSMRFEAPAGFTEDQHEMLRVQVESVVGLFRKSLLDVALNEVLEVCIEIVQLRAGQRT